MASKQTVRSKAGNPTKNKHVHRTPSSLTREMATLRAVRRDDSKEKSRRDPRLTAWLAGATALASCKAVVSLMPQVEHKDLVPPYRGSGYPVELAHSKLGYRFQDTKESLILRDTFRSLFGEKHYRFRISTALNMSSNGSNAVNSVLSVSAIQFASDFVSLSTVFNEFFVVAMHSQWQPVSRYGSPGGPQAATFELNIPLGMASLQHGASAYTSLATMGENYDFQYTNTGTPFSTSWINTEKSSETVLVSQTSNTQSWCTTGNAANYQGQQQFLSQSAPPKLPVSTVLGTFMTYWDVLFRVRQ